MKRPITLVLLGDIAAGKGTQAKILAKKYHLKLIDVGVFSRKMAAKKKDFARIRIGKLAPSNPVQKYLKRELARLKSVQGLILDGGKMPAEAKLIYRMLKKQRRKILVIYLTIPQTESFQRVTGRLKNESRHDDSPEAIKNRIRYYRDIYSKTVKFWNSKRVLKKVNGLGTVTQVNKRLVRTINESY